MPANQPLHWLGGFIADLPTPFDDDDRIDWQAFAILCEHQIKSGATAIVGETMGEASTLSREEHEEIISAAANIARGRIAVIAGMLGFMKPAVRLPLVELGENERRAVALTITAIGEGDQAAFCEHSKIPVSGAATSAR